MQGVLQGRVWLWSPFWEHQRLPESALCSDRGTGTAQACLTELGCEIPRGAAASSYGVHVMGWPLDRGPSPWVSLISPRGMREPHGVTS